MEGGTCSVLKSDYPSEKLSWREIQELQVKTEETLFANCGTVSKTASSNHVTTLYNEHFGCAKQ